MRCVQCGKELTASANFCTSCGTPVEKEQREVVSNSTIVNNGGEYSGSTSGAYIQNTNNIVQETTIEKLKKNWNDKYTIAALAAVMLIAVVIGLVIKNNITPKQTVNNTVYQDSYEDYDDYDNVGGEESNEYTNSTNNSQDYIHQGVEDNKNTLQGYILPESNTRYLNKSDLAGLTAEECRLARNEIYARHGRMFNDEGLQKYFESFDWYTPTIQPNDFQEAMLNAYEIANRDLIVDYEQEQGYR